MKQKRVNCICKDMRGCHIFDGDHRYEVIDQAKINGVIYLLTQDGVDSYTIHKIPNVHQYVKLSDKRILQNKQKFSNHVYWKEHSTIHISADGKIESVELGTIFGPCNMSRRRPNKYVQIIIGIE